MARRRVLAIWSALSTPLILIIIGNAFRPSASAPLRSLIIVAGLALLTIEAIARRQLVRFLLTLVILIVASAVVLFVLVLVVLQGWHIALAAVCILLAVILLVTNLRELRSD